jgi:hypothetical protein
MFYLFYRKNNASSISILFFIHSKVFKKINSKKIFLKILLFVFRLENLNKMKKAKKLIVHRSSDYTGGGFGFTLRHFVIYPPSISVNDILRVKYSS